MQELIQKLQDEHGLTQDQSHGILSTVTNFLKEKFPMMESTLNNLMPKQDSINSTQASGEPTTGSGFISEAEQFAKDKLGNFFGGNNSTS